MIDTSKPILQFLIPDLHSLQTIGVADSSFYPPNFAIINPTVEITPPAFPTITLPYNTGNLNVFNSNDLNITCGTSIDQLGNLPDGIWSIKMSISPNQTYNHTLNFMRTTAIRKRFGMAVMKTDISSCGGMQSQEQAYLDEISYYIECATAAGNDCNSVVAMNLLQQANKMLVDFLDNKSNYNLNPGYYLAGL